jgi:hypothetical protein
VKEMSTICDRVMTKGPNKNNFCGLTKTAHNKYCGKCMANLHLTPIKKRCLTCGKGSRNSYCHNHSEVFRKNHPVKIIE